MTKLVKELVELFAPGLFESLAQNSKTTIRLVQQLLSPVRKQKRNFSQIRLFSRLDVEDLFGFVDAAICDLNNAPCSFY